MSPTKKLFATFLLMFCASSANADPPKQEHVAMVHTPLSQSELLDALREGHLKTFGTLPSKNRLAMAWGQVAFENGGGKYSYNHNLGNVGSSGPGQVTYYSRLDAHWYRAFISFEDGAAAYWATIKHCTSALVAFDSGNPTVAARGLKACNYFEATLEEYTKGFASLFYTAINKIIPQEEREDERRTQELLAAIRRSVAEAGPAAAAPDPAFIDALNRDDY